jgi:hypothetical protein
VLRLINGRFYDNGFRRTAAMDALSGYDEIVVKPARDTGDGRGVYFVARADFETGIAALEDGNRHEDLTIQEPIRQSAALAVLNPSSVNTIRVMTRCFDGELGIVAAAARMGRPGSRIDNHDAGNLHIGLDDDGALRAFASDQNFGRYETIPGTDTPFVGLKIPNWPLAQKIVLDLQACFPEIGLMSWDVAFDENDQPIVIEVNLRRQGLNLLQIHNGPLFGDMLPEIVARTRPRVVFGHVIA